MDHIWVEHENCQSPGNCSICDGGLAVCKVCGHIEGSLTTECPGEYTYPEKGDLVYQGKLDFKNSKWVETASHHSPAFYRKFQNENT